MFHRNSWLIGLCDVVQNNRGCGSRIVGYADDMSILIRGKFDKMEHIHILLEFCHIIT